MQSRGSELHLGVNPDLNPDQCLVIFVHQNLHNFECVITKIYKQKIKRYWDSYFTIEQYERGP